MGYELPPRIHYFSVSVYPKYRALPPAESLFWKDIDPERFFRWKWYFKYRAALLQVKYPKGTVVVKEGSTQPKSDDEIKSIKLYRLKNRITARKRKITEWKNKLSRFKENWNSLFPIEEAPNYQEALHKIADSERMLKELVEDLENLIN